MRVTGSELNIVAIYVVFDGIFLSYSGALFSTVYIALPSFLFVVI